jgi:hypothetical protein
MLRFFTIFSNRLHTSYFKNNIPNYSAFVKYCEVNKFFIEKTKTQLNLNILNIQTTSVLV